MPVEVHYRVVVDFEGVQHSAILEKVKPLMEAFGIEDTWIALHKTSYMPDSLSLIVTDHKVALALDEVAVEAVRELGGTLLMPR